MTKKFKMPEPDGMDVGVYYWPETVKQALRDVLEQAAQAFEKEKVMVLQPCKSYTADEIAQAHRSTLKHCAKAIRAMIGEIE
jgi:arabinogalactan endo-1,4-beta-galactosidase